MCIKRSLLTRDLVACFRSFLRSATDCRQLPDASQRGCASSRRVILQNMRICQMVQCMEVTAKWELPPVAKVSLDKRMKAPVQPPCPIACIQGRHESAHVAEDATGANMQTRKNACRSHARMNRKDECTNAHMLAHACACVPDLDWRPICQPSSMGDDSSSNRLSSRQMIFPLHERFTACPGEDFNLASS